MCKVNEEKRNVFVNFTNHPFEQWEEVQKSAALKYGEVVDVPFPQVDEYADTQEVIELAKGYVEQIISLEPIAVLCQGEFCVTYHVVTALIHKGVKVMAACSKRETSEVLREDGSTEKTVVYKFVRFREYT